MLTMPMRLLLTLLFVLATTCAQAQTPAGRIRLASLEWAPYVGPDLPQQGYAADVVRNACARAGYTVDIDFLPWARAVIEALRGNYDGLMPEYFDHSREGSFAYSAPFPGGPIALYRRRDRAIAFRVDPRHNPSAALHELVGLRIGVVRDYLNTPEFDRADYLTKEEAASDEVNLSKLAYGRIDLAIVDREVASYLLRTALQDQADAVVMIDPPLENKALHIAWSRRASKAEAMREACDAGLKSMQADGSIAKLREAHGLQ
jgi:polar amino acid transport system substrate-binding protein